MGGSRANESTLAKMAYRDDRREGKVSFLLEELRKSRAPRAADGKAVRELVATNDYGDVVVLDHSNTLQYLSLSDESPRLTDIICNPPIPRDAYVTKFKFNGAASHILVCTPSSLYCVSLPPRGLGGMLEEERKRLDLLVVTHSDGSRELVKLKNIYQLDMNDIEETLARLRAQGVEDVANICRRYIAATAIPIGLYAEAPTPIAQADWHPLSDNHVAVLETHTGLFRLYNVATRPEVSEQEFDLMYLSDVEQAKSDKVVSPLKTSSFAFGFDEGWERFTCYFASESGQIYALCPIVPHGCFIRGNDLDLLRRSGEVALERATRVPEKQSNVGVRPSAEARVQWIDLHWTSAFGGSQAPDPARASNDALDAAKDGRKSYSNSVWMKFQPTSIAEDGWSVALQGPFECTPPSPLTSWKQGEAPVCCSLCTLDGRRGKVPITMLCRAFRSGHVEFLVVIDPVIPKWAGYNAGSSEVAAQCGSLLVECIGLCSARSSPTELRLVKGTPRGDFVYVIEDQNVHSVYIPWVQRLGDALLNGGGVADLPQSVAKRVVSVAPVDSDGAGGNSECLCGVDTVSNIRLGHMMLCRLSSGQVAVVNLSTEKYSLSSSDGAVQQKIPSLERSGKLDSAVGPIKSFSEVLLPFQERGLCMRSIVSGKTSQEQVSPASLRFFAQIVNEFCTIDMVNIRELHEATKARLQLLTRLHQEQRKCIQKIQRDLSLISAKAKNTEERVHRMKRVEKNLQARSAAVLQAVQENQPRISKAEKEYHRHLVQTKVRVQKLQAKIQEQRVRSAEVRKGIRQPTTSPVRLDDTVQERCFDLLKAQKVLISESQTKIKLLEKQMSDLVV